MNSNDSDAYFNRGIAYYRQGKYELALIDFTKVIEISPQDAGAYSNRAYCYCKLGRTELAKADEEKAINFGVKISRKCQ